MRLSTLFWRVWDFLTHTSYRVKIKSYSDGYVMCYPQYKYRCIPMWFYHVEDAYYGGRTWFRNESLAWETIDCMKKSDDMNHLVRVDVKYEE